MMVKLEKDNEHEKKKAESVSQIAHKMFATLVIGRKRSNRFQTDLSIIVFEENGCCWTPAFFALSTLGLE